MNRWLAACIAIAGVCLGTIGTAAEGSPAPPLVFDSTNWPPAANGERSAEHPLSTSAPGDGETESAAARWTRLTKDALRGDPDASYRLGMSFAEKQGPRATQRALEWLGQAAEAGHAEAMFDLSRVHDRIARAGAASTGLVERDSAAAARAADTWLARAKQAGSLRSFAWACGAAFDEAAPAALRRAARADCYVGLERSDPGSRSREWFRSRWQALPGSEDLPEDLDFRASLVRHAHLIPESPVPLRTRIRPAEHPSWRDARIPLVPLASGHSWTRETDSGDEIVERVTDRYEWGGKSWFRIETRSGSRNEPAVARLARTDAEGLFEAEGWPDDREGEEPPPSRPGHLVFPFPAGAGSEVVIARESGEIEVVRVLREGVTVQTPAGRFECMRFAYSVVDPGSDPTRTPPMILDFAPGIGLVRVREPLVGSPSELTGYDLSTALPAAVR